MAPEPSEDIKNIIEKTAEFVARLGATFEKKIADKEAHNPKFSFLQSYDTYYEFYQQRLKHWRDEYGKNSSIIAVDSAASSWQNSSEPPPPPPALEMEITPSEPLKQEGTIAEPAKHGPTSLAYRIIQVQRKIKAEERKLEPPPDPLYIRDIPTNLSSLELDIIRLTAQFVARNGNQFQVGLLNRENKNAQFDFLKPNNPLNQFFLGLVESYTRCSLAGKGISEKLMSDYHDKQDLLDRIILQHEWELEEAKKQKTKEERDEEERQQSQTIDWHDFVVVETIAFEDDVTEQPNMAEESNINTSQPAEMETEDVEMDVEEQPVSKKPPEIKVRKDYVKPTLGVTSSGPKFQRCPQCGQDIPVDEMQEHIKIELLDPKFRLQRQMAAEKNKIPVLVSDDEITRNLGAFAKRRADIFGESEDAQAKADEDKPKDKVIWDGHSASIPKTINSAKVMEMDHSSTGGQPPILPNTGIPIMNRPPQPPVPISQPPIIPNPGIPGPGILQQPPAPIAVVSTISKPPTGPIMPQRMLPTYVPPTGVVPSSVVEEPQPKKQKIEDIPMTLISEDQFLAKHSGQFTLQVQCPVEDEKPEWKLQGQTLTITIDYKDSVKNLKEKIKDLVNIPPNKQKLKGNGHHLKDTPTVAFYNFTKGTIVSLSIRERGGKK